MKESKLVTTPLDYLTYKIIGCAMAVHSKLGPGYREDTYQRDLEEYFIEQKIPVESQKLFEVLDSAAGGCTDRLLYPGFRRRRKRCRGN